MNFAHMLYTSTTGTATIFAEAVRDFRKQPVSRRPGRGIGTSRSVVGFSSPAPAQ